MAQGFIREFKKEDIRKLLGSMQGLTETAELEMADSVLEVSLTANKQAVQELMGDGNMYEALMEIMGPQLILRDEANRKEGMQQGEYQTLYSLVCDNVITMESAAARKNLTVEDFYEKLKELNIV